MEGAERERRERKERGRGWKVIRAEPLVTTLFTPSRGPERLRGRDPSLTLRMKTEEEFGGTVYYLLRRSEMEISSRRTAQKHTEAKTPPSRQAIPVGKLISAPDSRIPLL